MSKNLFSSTTKSSSELFSSAKKSNSKDQPFYLDALNVLAIPQRIVTGVLASATDKKRKKNVLKTVIDTVTLKEKRDFADFLNNVGWKQRGQKEGYSFLQGQKGKFDFFDIVNFTGNVGLDPLTYLTGGGSSAVKVGGNAAFNIAKNIAKANKVNLDSAITMSGQKKAIQKMLDEISKKTSGKAKTQNQDKLFKTQKAIEGLFNRNKKLDDLIKGTTDQNVLAKLTKELDNNTKLISKKQTQLDFLKKSDKSVISQGKLVQSYMKQIDDAARAGRAKGQNALLNFDVPFTKISKSFGTKPDWLKVKDLKISSTEILAANKMLDQSFTSAEDLNKIKELSKSRKKLDKQQLDNFLKEISNRKAQFLQKAYGVSNINDLTLQGFKDLEKRVQMAKSRDLPNYKITDEMVEPNTGKPQFDVFSKKEGYKSKYLRNYSIKGVPKSTRSLLDELEYTLNLAFEKGGGVPSQLQQKFLKRIETLISQRPLPKGVKPKAEAEQLLKKLIDDVNKQIDYSKVKRYAERSTKGTTTGLDTSRFVADMGGSSRIGAFFRRKNIFNARTLGSTDESVNDVGELIRIVENSVLGRTREAERVVMEIKKLSKGLTPEQVKSLVYIAQKAFPDELLDDAVAKQIKDLEVDIMDFKNQLEVIKKSKSKENVLKKDQLKGQIEQLQNKVKDIRSKNQIPYKQAVLKIANGDQKVAEQLETVAQKLRNLNKMFKEAEIKAGALKETRANYFAHVLNYSQEKVNELKQIYKNDPDIGALITKSAGNRFAKERKSFQTMAEVDNKIAVLQERINTLPANSPEINTLYEKINVISNLYERDPFAAMTKRYYKSIKTVAMKELQNTLVRRGYILKKGEKPALNSGQGDVYKVLEGAEAKALGLPEGTQIHSEVLEGLGKVKAVFTSKGMENILQHAEAATNAFKTVTTTLVPSHYWFNFIGSIANNAMAGVSPSAYKKAMEIMRARKNGTMNAEQERIYNYMLDNAVVNQTSFADLLSSSTAGLERTDRLAKIEKAIVDNPATRFAREKVGDPMDNFFRIAHFVDVFDKTNSVKLASDSVRKYLFNYSEITSADRFAKVIIPFWNWSKNNIPLQVHKLLTTPRFGLTYMKIKDQAQGDVANDPTVPDWLKSDYIKMGENSFYNVRTPLQDLATATDIRKGLGLQTPFTKVPFELALNKTLFRNKPIDYDYAYGETEGYSAEALRDYLLSQTGLTSRAVSAYEGFSNAEDNKKWYDNVRDMLFGKTFQLKE